MAHQQQANYIKQTRNYAKRENLLRAARRRPSNSPVIDGNNAGNAATPVVYKSEEFQLRDGKTETLNAQHLGT